MGIPGKGLTTYMDIGNNRLNKKKSQGLPLLKLLIRTSVNCSISLIIHLIKVTKVNSSTMKQLSITSS